MGSEASPVQVDIERGVARVTMNSPHNRNALSGAMIDGLIDAVEAAVADPAVRVLVLTHTGPVFCSGADLKETAAALAGQGGPADPAAQGGPADPAAQGGSMIGGRGGAEGPGPVPAGRLGELIATICECPKPVLARIAGPARAGGLGLIAAADLAVCATEASFAFTEVRVGVIPAVISAVVLPRLTPRAAAELYLTGEPFDGARAERIGLVTAAVPAAELDAATDRYVEALRRGAPGAMAGAKSLLLREATATLRDDLADLTELSIAYFGSAEGIEGMLAFREKRDPGWISQSL
ncbi:enoyl-CoA hydratase family protein [Rugosimonospora acidiphila]|uniref:Enoyl-CoA hydratase family protein n=1 Tax=Rugosimonospora acidiphila TaxID=556531 RepID=A0ABP9RQR8_9ACTN